MLMKRTKIICTMGPASSKKNTLRAMMRAGMDIARFNFSHGSHEEHLGLTFMKEKLHRLNVRSVMQALTSLLSSPAKRHGLPNTLSVLHRVSAKTS